MCELCLDDLSRLAASLFPEIFPMLLLKKYENTYSIQKCKHAFVCLCLCVCAGGGKFSIMDDLTLQNSSLHICFANALECSDQCSGKANGWD